jgi:C-terminal processing protease CtpA/Prc
VKEKFYVTNLHGVNWDLYYKEYKAKVPAVFNNYDFADLMSEMLGELNASHTGAFYGNEHPGGDKTACLGFFYDQSFNGDGLKIKEVLKKNPVVSSTSKIKAGVVIEAIDGQKIMTNTNYYPYLNRKSGVNTLLDLFDPAAGVRWQEVVKPIAMGHERELMYRRWVDRCAEIVDSLSGGKIGYVHVRGMDDQSFREVYDVTLGKHAFKQALIVDTRFNGGGWLHEDLVTFLSGKEYISFQPRGQNLGGESDTKWTKPSAVVMNETNYSDAHMFPFAYKELQVGPLIGMPVAGTGTAVWWENLQNGVVFGIPQVGMVDKRGQYLENQQLEPDYKLPNEASVMAGGRDQQLEKAVEILMKR